MSAADETHAARRAEAVAIAHEPVDLLALLNTYAAPTLRALEREHELSPGTLHITWEPVA